MDKTSKDVETDKAQICEICCKPSEIINKDLICPDCQKKLSE